MSEQEKVPLTIDTLIQYLQYHKEKYGGERIIEIAQTDGTFVVGGNLFSDRKHTYIS